ncbi:MAG: MiaB/RimO family radical SAM methylthiotransferase [Candidatus Babeliales bacterium]|jgi:tRNA-2-methylthio-N6-dimethylallyladenosine synthase
MVTFFNKIYGCQANFADSQGLAKFLVELGCKQVMAEKDADLIIINTCAIREKAEQKLYSYIGRLAELKKDKPHLKIGVIGCVASYKKKEFYEYFECISFVHGAREEISALQGYLAELILNIQTAKSLFLQNPDSKIKYLKQDRRLKKFFDKQATGSDQISISRLNLTEQIKESNTREEEQIKEDDTTESEQISDVRAMINIMTGCNKYCSYCIVPFTRGREISYPMSDILNAVKKDIDRGAKDITLIGQNVNSYIDPQTGARFPELLQKVASLEGDFWVRFISPHPQDMTKDLFQVMANNRPKLTAFLHFPLQSGSDTILKAMNRNYTSAEFLEKIGWIKELMPDAGITTDIIVGFPGETEKDYLATREVMEKVQFDQIYSFIYSKRKFTKAYNMPDDCPQEEKARRLSELQMRQREISLDQNRKNIGKTLKVLVEKELEPGKLLARTEGNARVLITSNNANLVGSFVGVKIESTTVVNMSGTVIVL